MVDSSNSGSFQSDCGDTEEFDSTPLSISSFFNNPIQFSPNTNPIIKDPGPASTWTGAIPSPRPDHTRRPDHHHHPIGVTLKNPKKRSRASRRAPTTVLTTDTTNFRQMVQQFTGIPTSPFATTVDLFRPMPLKIQHHHQPSFLNNINNNNNITVATSSSSFQLQPSTMHEFQKQPSTLLDLQNPMLSFQSLLQTSQRNELNELQSSPTWRDQSEKLDSGLGNVAASRSGADQLHHF